jgi:very-short-patch-repair endonuclease
MEWDSRERALAEVAGPQHLVFPRQQALAAGFSPSTLKRRVATGRWRRQGRRVYTFGGLTLTWRGRVSAAVLDHPRAAASHRTAAALFGVPGFPPAPIDLSVWRGGVHRHAGATLHETSWLPDDHLRVVDGIRCTTLARTIFDLAGTERPGRVGRALDNSTNHLGLEVEQLEDVLAAMGRRGRPGTALIRELLDARGEGYVATESELEDLLLEVLRERGVPLPRRQVHVGGDRLVGRVDFAYVPEALIIEADGRRYHTAKLDLDADRARDNELMAAGWRVLRVTWDDLVHRPDRVATMVRTALRTTA